MLPAAEARKPKYPTEDERAETASVLQALVSASTPLAIPDIARRFQQGRAVEKRVALTMLALARVGLIASPDGGETFTVRR